MFLALDISATNKVEIAQWRQQHLSLPFKAVDPQNFHITLAFLGLIDDIKQANIEKLIAQQHSVIQQQLKPFVANKAVSLVLSQVGYFEKAQVLHLMPKTILNWLTYLNNKIVDASLKCGITLESRSYQPHLSLYRKAKCQSFQPSKKTQDTVVEQQLSITSFSLYHSYSTPRGVHYQPVQRWKISF